MHASDREMPVSTKAAELCRYFTLGSDARRALRPEMTPDEFLAVCHERKWYSDAIQFIAHYLPKRQSVFWALACVKQSPPDQVTPEIEAALKAAERWIADPSDENRKVALKAAEDADSSTPAGATALAAYYSSGQPQTADPKLNARGYFMSAKLVSGAVMLAATTDRDDAIEALNTSVARGLEIVSKTRR